MVEDALLWDATLPNEVGKRELVYAKATLGNIICSNETNAKFRTSNLVVVDNVELMVQN